MTDAQHQAHQQAAKRIDHKKGRIINIVRTNPGITFLEVARKYELLFRQLLPEPTAVGRLSELAKEGIVYVNGKKEIDGRILSRYYYEPDPACRFRIRDQREAEDFIKWVKKGEAEFSEFMPAHVSEWVREQHALLVDAGQEKPGA